MGRRVCTSISPWKTEVQSIAGNAADAITEPGTTRADVEAAVESGLDATKTLGDELRAAVPPDTPEGQEAKAAVDGFLGNVQQSDDEVRAAIAGLPEEAGVAEIVAELSGLATSIQQTIDSGRTLVTNIQELSSAPKDGFENADSCQELGECLSSLAYGGVAKLAIPPRLKSDFRARGSESSPRGFDPGATLVAAGHHLADREALRALAAERVAEGRECLLVVRRAHRDVDRAVAGRPSSPSTSSARSCCRAACASGT